MSGEIGLLEHLWGRSPFSVRRRAEVAQRADRGNTHTQTRKDFTQLRAARMRKTLLLLVWIDSSSCSGAQEATVSLEIGSGLMSTGCPPSYVAWASFYMLKVLPTGSDAGEGRNVNGLCVQCCTVLSYLLLTAGDKGIKCPSRSLGQHRGGPLGAPPFATMVVACHRIPQAAQCPATCLWGKSQSDAWAGELERSSEVATCRGK